MPARAAQQHAARQRAGGIPSAQALLVAPVQQQAGRHGAAARLLRQQRDADAVRQRLANHAGLDIGRRGVERLPGAERFPAAVIGQRLLEVGRRRDGGTVGVAGRQEHAEHPIGRFEVGARDALHVGHADCAQAVAVEEEQAPVADRLELGQRLHQRAGVALRLVEIVQQLGLGAADLVGAHRVLADALQRAEQRVARRIDRGALGQPGAEGRKSGIVQRALGGPAVARQPFLHQRAVQTPGGRVAEHAHQDVERGVVGVAAGGDAVQGADQRRFAAAAQGDGARAVLHRLHGVERRQRARRARDRAEVLLHQLQRARGLETPGDDQQRVVGLVPGAVEALEARNRHVLDVRSRADDRVAVVVPAEGELERALEQHRAGVVLAHLELVAHHRHLALEIGLGDERVDHPVRFHAERPLQVGLARRHGLEVVGAVVGGGAVPARAAAGELALEVGMVRRALEHHVLEQVRHALLAVALVARADQVGDVHRHGVGAGVRHGEDAQAVVEPVFGHALDRGDLLRRFGGRGSCPPRAGAARPFRRRW